MRDIRPINKGKLPGSAPQRPAKPAQQDQARSAARPAKPAATVGPKPPRQAPGASSPAPTAASASARRSWRIGRREQLIIFGLLLAAIITGTLAALIFLPTADIQLVLRTAPLLVDEKLTLRAEGKGENVIPGTAFFREVPVEGSQAATGQEIIGKKARGTVQVVNRTTQEQKIKEQSRLVTSDNRLFYMQQAVTLPPGPSQLTVEVEADIAGPEGNIKPQKLYFAALPESTRPLLYAEVTQALTGGAGDPVQVVTENDLESARTNAGQMARRQVEAEIIKELPDGWKILDESWSMDVQAFDTAIAAGSREPSIPYTARVMVRVLGYEEKALEDRLHGALEARMDKEFSLFPGPLSFTTTVENVRWEAGEADLSVRVTHTTIPNIQLPTLRGKLLGQSVEEAKKYLEGLPGVRSVKIATWPFWVTKIPRIEDRVKLDLQSERQP